MKPFSLIATMVLLALVLFSFVPPQDKTWKVPDAAQKVKNPTKNTADNINIGKGLYAKHCRSCHGKNGEGDGPKAAELETPAGDFTSEEFKAQSDGTLYYKTTEGRDDMPSFKKKIPSDEERWLIVNYLKTLEK